MQHVEKRSVHRITQSVELAEPLPEAIEFMTKCSRTSLDSLYLSRLALDSHLKKELINLLQKCVENLGDIRFANLIRGHGEEIIAQLSGQHSQSVKPKNENSETCLCKQQKRQSHPFCYRCFQRLPASMKYDLSSIDEKKQSEAVLRAEQVLQEIIDRHEHKGETRPPIEESSNTKILLGAIPSNRLKWKLETEKLRRGIQKQDVAAPRRATKS
jgi:hypothetical protein